jgi:hypothetical protein
MVWCLIRKIGLYTAKDLLKMHLVRKGMKLYKRDKSEPPLKNLRTRNLHRNQSPLFYSRAWFTTSSFMPLDR